MAFFILPLLSARDLDIGQATNCYGEPLVKIRLIPFRQNRSSGFTRSLPSAKIVAFPVHETPIYIPSYRPGVSLYMVRPTQTSGHSSRIHVLYHRVEKIGAFSISQDSLCTLKVLQIVYRLITFSYRSKVLWVIVL
jgi:hypothetical protein